MTAMTLIAAERRVSIERPTRKYTGGPSVNQSPRFRYVGPDAEFRSRTAISPDVGSYDIEAVSSLHELAMSDLGISYREAHNIGRSPIELPVHLNWKPAIIVLIALVIQATFITVEVGLHGLMLAVVPTVFVFFFILLTDARGRISRS